MSRQSNTFAQAAACLKKHHVGLVLDATEDGVAMNGRIFLDKIQICGVAKGQTLGFGNRDLPAVTAFDFLQAKRQE